MKAFFCSSVAPTLVLNRTGLQTFSQQQTNKRRTLEVKQNPGPTYSNYGHIDCLFCSFVYAGFVNSECRERLVGTQSGEGTDNFQYKYQSNEMHEMFVCWWGTGSPRTLSTILQYHLTLLPATLGIFICSCRVPYPELDILDFASNPAGNSVCVTFRVQPRGAGQTVSAIVTNLKFPIADFQLEHLAEALFALGPMLVSRWQVSESRLKEV
jgi:hypothetical protein